MCTVKSAFEHIDYEQNSVSGNVSLMRGGNYHYFNKIENWSILGSWITTGMYTYVNLLSSRSPIRITDCFYVI